MGKRKVQGDEVGFRLKKKVIGQLGVAESLSKENGTFFSLDEKLLRYPKRFFLALARTVSTAATAYVSLYPPPAALDNAPPPGLSPESSRLDSRSHSELVSSPVIQEQKRQTQRSVFFVGARDGT